MRHLIWLLALLVVMVGCDNKTIAPESPELIVDPELTEPLEDEPILFDFNQDATYLSEPLSEGGTFASIWRDLIRPFDNTWIIEQIGIGLFEVTRYAVIHGTLFVSWEDGSVTQKELTCNGTRRAIVSRPARGRPGVLEEVSGALIVTEGGTVAIERVEVTAGFGTMVIDDPLELVAFPEELLHLSAGEEVTVRVYGLPEDAIVMLRTPQALRYFAPYTLEIRDGYFDGTWYAPQVPGLYRAAVDVLSHDTVYAPEAPYDGTAWIMPYVVE
jgi:hypothetical protein